MSVECRPDKRGSQFLLSSSRVPHTMKLQPFWMMLVSLLSTAVVFVSSQANPMMDLFLLDDVSLEDAMQLLVEVEPTYRTVSSTDDGKGGNGHKGVLRGKGKSSKRMSGRGKMNGKKGRMNRKGGKGRMNGQGGPVPYS
jgi:hypothetical protein